MKRALGIFQVILLTVGAVSAGWYGCAKLLESVYQRSQERQLDREIAQASRIESPLSLPGDSRANVLRTSIHPNPAPQPIHAVRTETAERPGRPGLARIEIPRLGIRAMVGEGIDDRTLALAVGHVPGTPFPGEPGNSAIAGHRDTFFRHLGGIRRDDTIRVTSSRGVFTYVVDGVEVVNPDDVEVLSPRSESTLTLVTCFPFDYIGPAPKRFVVIAHRSS
jgi:LPXTG-site transpeptidase (sortase) family protein